VNTGGYFAKESLKIPKGLSEAVYGEVQTMQWPKEKGQTMICKTLHRKLKIEQHEPPQITGGVHMCCGRIRSSSTKHITNTQHKTEN
jgi:hypothetical protein